MILPSRAYSVTVLLLAVALSGCASAARTGILQQTDGSAALFGQFRIFDAQGRPSSFDQMVERAADSDVILFGEEHSDIVCNAIEAQLLAALSRKARPISLAMEFFEIDTQNALDAYLDGRLAEPDFRKLTRQKRSYATSHRPLIEYCRAASIPVIAANAPARLVRSLRLSGKPYSDFRDGLDPADRALLPADSELLDGAYHDAFLKAMADHITAAPPSTQPATSAPASAPASQPDKSELLLRSYRSQSLWDDAMAGAVDLHRSRYSNRRVMLIIGGFHVASDGGTKVKLARRRPVDKLLTVVYRGVTDPGLGFDEDDRAAGDIIIYGIKPPEEEKSRLPSPTTAPTATSAPTPAPHGATTAPAGH